MTGCSSDIVYRELSSDVEDVARVMCSRLPDVKMGAWLFCLKETVSENWVTSCRAGETGVHWTHRAWWENRKLWMNLKNFSLWLFHMHLSCHGSLVTFSTSYWWSHFFFFNHQMNPDSHVILCGQIAVYNKNLPYPPPIPDETTANLRDRNITRYCS